MFVCEIWHKKSSHKGVFWCAWCICVRWQDQRNLSWKRPRIIKYNSEVNGQYGDGTPTLALPEPCSNLDYDDPCHYKSKFKCILRLGISQYLFFNRNLVEMERPWHLFRVSEGPRYSMCDQSMGHVESTGRYRLLVCICLVNWAQITDSVH